MTATWDDRLISRERAYALAAGWALQTNWREGNVFTDCLDCGQAVMRCTSNMAASGYVFTPDSLVSAVVRHMVMAHNQPLSGLWRTDGPGRDRRSAEAGEDPDRGRGDRRGGGAAGPGGGPADQEAGH